MKKPATIAFTVLMTACIAALAAGCGKGSGQTAETPAQESSAAVSVTAGGPGQEQSSTAQASAKQEGAAASQGTSAMTSDAAGTQTTDTTGTQTAEETAAAKPRNVTTLTKGTLTVSISPDYAPYEFYLVNGENDWELAGFETELARYIAQELGLEIAFLPTTFEGTIMDIANKRVDLALAGYKVTEARRDVMDFSDIYYGASETDPTAGNALGVMKGNEALLEAVNEAIFNCTQSGELDAWRAQADAQMEEKYVEGLPKEQ